jgi:hypothetical protein
VTEAVAKDLGALSGEQRSAALMADAPELLALLSDLQVRGARWPPGGAQRRLAQAQARRRCSRLSSRPLTACAAAAAGSDWGLLAAAAPPALATSWPCHGVARLLGCPAVWPPSSWAIRQALCQAGLQPALARLEL